ncbi:hypothetical protein GCM10027610_063250 [Dactylosporangium cerinum]
MSGDRVVGTMDFFTTEYIELSESRASALRNVQQLVSQRLDIVRSGETAAENARQLLDSISRLRSASQDATRVAREAVARASEMTTNVTALSESSIAIGDVIKIISSIADQTNLLALNATIEAARAGDVGKGSRSSPARSRTWPGRPPRPRRRSPSRSPASRPTPSRSPTASTSPARRSVRWTPSRPASTRSSRTRRAWPSCWNVRREQPGRTGRAFERGDGLNRFA